MLAYEKERSEQNRKVSKILGPPEVIVDDVIELDDDVIELEDDIPQLNSLRNSDSDLLFDFDVPDEVDEILATIWVCLGITKLQKLQLVLQRVLVQRCQAVYLITVQFTLEKCRYLVCYKLL